MFKYLIHRMLLSVPTLLIISVLAFGLGKYAPGDPVVNVFGEEPYSSLDPAKQAITYRAKAEQLGIAGPTFYFSLTTSAYPDTLWRIFPLDRRERLEKLIGQTGNWNAVKTYDEAVSATAQAIEALPQSNVVSAQLRSELTFLVRIDQLSLMDSAARRILDLNSKINRPVASEGATEQDSVQRVNPQKVNYTDLDKALVQLKAATESLHTQKKLARLNIPSFQWYGFHNQYHHWLQGFLSGDLGLTRRKMKVWSELQSSLLSTMTINGLAIFLAYLLAIPLGVEMARRKGKRLDRWGKVLLFFLYSMPVFWLGGLLIMVFTNTEWGQAMLPSLYFDIQDAWQPGAGSFSEWWSANASKCILPILILTLHTLAILVLQMRSGMLGALNQDYIRTARAKGVSEEDVHWTHAFRNGLFPIITIFASVLPAVFTGSLVVEALFNFPGIGTKTFEAYLGKDLPLLSAIMMLAATLTIVGSLLADILYAWADPRVRFAKKNG